MRKLNGWPVFTDMSDAEWEEYMKIYNTKSKSISYKLAFLSILMLGLIGFSLFLKEGYFSLFLCVPFFLK